MANPKIQLADKKTIRNISLFILIALASGWLGRWIDTMVEPAPEGESPGMGIWLVLPLLTTILLRLFAGDGWKDIGLKPNFKGNGRWYFLSLIIFPVVTAAVLIIGNMVGWISFSNFRTGVYLAGFTGTLAANFVKNIFVESVWRGYLTAKLVKLHISDIWLYLIVGGVWGAWHLPYYLFFLPASDMYQVLPVGRLPFAAFAMLSMICWSIMFVELYRLTQSLWPVVLLHVVEDSLINHLVIDGHLLIASGKEIFISPIVGTLISLFYIIVGLFLRRHRMRETSFPV